jgi:signal transduction histidine kinase/FixJ family two-component response regulator/HPt (histidine-containing phosphotransfer) domain-containing protein
MCLQYRNRVVPPIPRAALAQSSSNDPHASADRALFARARTVNLICLVASIAALAEQLTRGTHGVTLGIAAFLTLLLGAEWWVLRTTQRLWAMGSVVTLTLAACSVTLVWISGVPAVVWVAVVVLLSHVRWRGAAATVVGTVTVVAAAGVIAFANPGDLATVMRVLIGGIALVALAYVTARSVRMVEEDLAAASQLLDDTVGAMAQGVLVIAPDGRVRFINPRGVELLDLPAALLGPDLTAQHILDLQRRRGELGASHHPQPAAHAPPDWRTVIDAAPPRYTRRTRDGRWVEVQTRRMPSGDTVRTYADVSSYEEARARAEVAAEAKIRFLSNMSHELRTPMNAILGLTERTLATDLRGTQRSWLRRIDEAGRELLTLVDGILEVSEPEMDRLAAESREVVVADVVQRGTAEAAAAGAGKGIAFAIDIAPSVPATIVGDGRSLEQVLRHLATNAVRFTTQGRVEVRVRAERVDQAMLLTFAVQDTGVGFDAKERERLFSAFESSDVAAAHGYGGSALGLALAKRIVDRMDGELGVQSQRGVGSTFWFSARFADASPPADVPVSVPPVPAPALPERSPAPEPPTDAELVDALVATTAEFPTPAPMSEVQERVFVLMQQLNKARRRLATIPQRTYFLTATFGALAIFGVVLVQLARLAVVPGMSISRGLFVVPIIVGVLLAVIAVRQRQPGARSAREMRLSAAALLLVYVISMLTNGHPPVLMLAAWIAGLYVTQQMRDARVMSTLAVAAAVWTLARTGGPFEILVRSLAGGLMVWALMEMLMPVLGDALKAFGAAATSLQSVSNELVLENQRLSISTAIAEDAARTKSEVVASVSHEIRTPVNAILGMSQVMLQGELAPRQRERLQKIEDSGRHLLALVNHVLDLSKLEAGKFRLDAGPVRLRAVLAHVLDAVIPEGEARRLEVGISVDRCVPEVVVGDRLRITQVLLNFLTNAAKYTERGHISVRVRCEEETADTMLLRFEVEDTGPGLTAEQRARLFQPFEQVHDAMHQQQGGAGLGLSISKWLVEQMGGSVGVESQPGVGSTFWFTARLGLSHDGEEAVASAERTRLDLLARRGARVLVVDDNDINREVAGALLRDAGIDVEEVDGGERAVARASREPFDLILMDLHMPGMDGFVATQRLRADVRTRQVPIVALTANALPEIRQRCLTVGMNDYLTKPFTQRDLAEVVVRWVPARVRPGTVRLDDWKTEERMPEAEGGQLGIPEARGLDTANGLERFLDDRELYRSMLERFVDEYGGFVAEFEGLLAQHDLETAHRRAHTLKSVAAMLGAEGVREAARKLEARVRADGISNDAPDALEELRQTLAPLLHDLRTAFAVDAATREATLPRPEGSPAQ